MATKEQIDEVSKEADVVIATSRTKSKTDYTPAEKPGPTVADLKAAIRELAVIARSHAPMQQDVRIGELLALAE